MVRLILEEGGRKRAFKLNGGTLTIGSDPGCALTLESPDVAEHHAELVVADDGVTLAPRAGVMPPTIQGRPVTAAKKLAPGTEFKIGSARLRIEDPDAPVAPSRKRDGRHVVGTPRTDGGGGQVHRTRPVATVKRGMPTWLLVVLLLGGLGGGGFALIQVIQTQASGETVPAADTLRFAQDNINGGNRKRAKQLLDNLDAASVPPDLQAVYEGLLRQVEDLDQVDRQQLLNIAGSQYFNTQLKSFEENRLKGDPPVEKIRVFLLRCREFREMFPNHPETDWVERQENRFRGRVNIDQPATFPEIAYEIETLTWAWPHRYGVAFERLAPYLVGPDAQAAQELHDSLVAERQKQFDDRMQQAKYEWTNEEKGNKGRAAEILRAIVVNYGDEAMVTQAANELIGLPGVKPLMEAWKRDKPLLFEEMMENSILRGYAKREGML